MAKAETAPFQRLSPKTVKPLDRIEKLYLQGLENAKKNYDNAAKAETVGNKKTAEDIGEKYSVTVPMNTEAKSDYGKPITVEDVMTLRSMGRKNVNGFTTEDIKKSEKWAYKFYKELGTKSPFFRAWYGDWRAYDTTPVKVANIPEYVATNSARTQNRGEVRNNDTSLYGNSKGWEIHISREGETNTISHSGGERLSEFGLSGIKQLIENAVLLDTEVHEHHSNNAKNDLIAFDHKLYALGKNTFGSVDLYRITVEEYFQDKSHPDKKKFHNLKYIKKWQKTSADALSSMDVAAAPQMTFLSQILVYHRFLTLSRSMIRNFMPGKRYRPNS